MKKRGIILLIAIYCAFQTLGCSSDQQQPLMVTLLGLASMYTIGGSVIVHEVEVIPGPSTVTATAGDYTDIVGVNWSLNNATIYNVYRSTSASGPFTQIATVNAADINTAPGTISNPTETPVEPPVTNNEPTTPPVTQAVFTSNVDLNMKWAYGFWPFQYYCYGIKVHSFETYKIGITLDGVSKTVSFKGSGFLTDLSFYTQDEVMSAINNAFGKTVCFAVNSGDKRYIKLVSNSGPIILKDDGSNANVTWESALEYFLQSDADWSTVITVNPVAVSTDTTKPTVMQTYPADGATNIALNAKIWASFSEAIKSSTVTATSYSLKITSDNTAVAGAVSGTAIFTPSAELLPMTQYTATLTTAVTDLSGNQLTAIKTWSFTTGGSDIQVNNFCYEDESVTAGQHYFYSVKSTFADNTVSEMSSVAEGFARIYNAQVPVPGKVTGCSASDGTSLTKVTITWNAVSDATYYRIFRIIGTTSFQVGGNITGTSVDDTTVTPGLFYYRVVPYNTSGEGVNSDLDLGFRAISNDEFFSEVYKENLWALNNIQKLKESGTGLLGTETLYDPDGDGSLVYNATATLSKAKMTLTFANFSAYYLIQNTLSGSPITAELSDPLGDCSGPMTGKLLITGIYNGYVRYDLQMTGGTVTGGSYWVSQNGGAEIEVPYDSDLVY